MIKENIEKIKSLVIAKQNKNPKKNIENLVVFILILIITLISINTIFKKEENQDKLTNTETTILSETNTKTSPEILNETIQQTEFEKNLETILAKINGAGKVNVMVSYTQSSEVVAMYNQSTKESKTEETDTGGGTRTIDQVDQTKDIVYTEENGNKTPVTQKIIAPKITGAIIIAEGAKNSTVKTNISKAVEAITGLELHKIQVFEMN